MSVINEDDIPWQDSAQGERFAARRKRLGQAAGGEQLGCSLYEVAPGKSAFPYHLHHANEEAIYVLSGAGRLRGEQGEQRIKEGDYIALVVGPRGAHELINDTEATLRYLCFSTMHVPEVAEYPDSDKIGVYAGTAPGAVEHAHTLKALFRADSKVDYYDGED